MRFTKSLMKKTEKFKNNWLTVNFLDFTHKLPVCKKTCELLPGH